MSAAGLDGYMVWQMQADEPEAGDDDPYGVGPCDPIDSVIRASSGTTNQSLPQRTAATKGRRREAPSSTPRQNRAGWPHGCGRPA